MNIVEPFIGVNPIQKIKVGSDKYYTIATIDMVSGVTSLTNPRLKLHNGTTFKDIVFLEDVVGIIPIVDINPTLKIKVGSEYKTVLCVEHLDMSNKAIVGKAIVGSSII